MRIAINGFGRIGRCLARAIFELGYDKHLNLTAINCSASPSSISYFLKYDSVHGKFPHQVTYGENWIKINDVQVNTINERDPSKINWAELEIDVVMECTGKFKSRAQASYHIDAGAKRVIISSPATDEDITVVYGINHHKIKDQHKLISAASCTTNCFVPILAVLHEKFGIKNGFMTTIHAYTNDQNILDSNHTNLYKSRACASSIIPTSTGAKTLIPKIIPELKNKIEATSIRVPTPNVSLVDFTFNASSNITPESINRVFHEVSIGHLDGIIGYASDPVVSIDINHDKHSAVFDSNHTMVLDGNLGRVVAWYDNEWGFSARMLDIACHIKQSANKGVECENN